MLNSMTIQLFDGFKLAQRPTQKTQQGPVDEGHRGANKRAKTPLSRGQILAKLRAHKEGREESFKMALSQNSSKMKKSAPKQADRPVEKNPNHSINAGKDRTALLKKALAQGTVNFSPETRAVLAKILK